MVCPEAKCLRAHFICKIPITFISSRRSGAERKLLSAAVFSPFSIANVLSREIHPEEMASLPVVLTQMHNFIKSNNAQPIGPIVQAMVVGEDRQMHLYMMQQATQFIGQMEQDYHMDAVLRVKNCLYAHYTGPMPESQLASYKLQVHAFENEQKLTGTSYTIYVNQDEDDAVVDVFMETK